jgi:hypothetical protein
LLRAMVIGALLMMKSRAQARRRCSEASGVRQGSPGAAQCSSA